MPRHRLTLARSLTLALFAITLVVALLLALLLRRWGDSLLQASALLRESTSRNAEATVLGTLGGAGAAVASVEKQVESGALDPDDPLAVERALFAQLLANGDLEEATFTRGNEESGPGRGRAWQVSVYRAGREPAALVTSFTSRVGHGYVVDRRQRPPGAPRFLASPFRRVPGAPPDPTAHLTFTGTLAHHRFSDAPLWTDLHYAERDESLPEAERRVVVTVMKAVEDGAGQVVGVVRVGLLASRLDEVTQIRVNPSDPNDPHRVFLADEKGRLLTRLIPGQPFEDLDGDLRPSRRGLPDDLRAALAQLALREVSGERPRINGRFDVGGHAYVLSASLVAGAQDWRIGVLVPEDYYLADLIRARRALVLLASAALVVLLVGGVLALRAVRRGLRQVVESAEAMREFDFAPAPAGSPFADMAAVMGELEQAKTALRAMGRYVPIGLVRKLYRDRREPTLGGELRELSLLFTDIEGFTSASEQLSPDRLARVLGRYFEALTAAIHEHGGTVDKYIGDAVMALWNAPEPSPGHAASACAAALACRDASRALERESLAQGLPRFPTRIGLHRAQVMVGHFGAPDRISYTALGDGVNLASRIEGLNKVYGTAILASEQVREAVGDLFSFRLVDKVAVKGRRGGVRVFELLGTGDAGPSPAAAAYERAFEAYLGRRFEDALRELQGHPDDPPGRVLAARCHSLLATPPPADWDGVFVAREK